MKEFVQNWIILIINKHFQCDMNINVFAYKILNKKFYLNSNKICKR